MFWPWSAITVTTSPISPRAITPWIAATCGRWRVHIASMTKTPAARAASKHLGRLGLVDRERLLDQHVLARGDRQQRVVVVLRVRARHVDGLHVRVGDQRLVAAVRDRDVELGSEPLRRARANASRRRRPRRSVNRATLSANLWAIPPAASTPQRSGGAVIGSGTVAIWALVTGSR